MILLVSQRDPPEGVRARAPAPTESDLDRERALHGLGF